MEGRKDRGKILSSRCEIFFFYTLKANLLPGKQKTLTGINITNLGTHCNIFHSDVKFAIRKCWGRKNYCFISSFRLNAQGVKEREKRWERGGR